MSGANRAPQRRAVPSVDRVLRTAQVGALLQEYARDPVVRLVRDELARQRARASDGHEVPDLVTIADAVVSQARQAWSQPVVPVINATGVVLHTNLGRAPLSEAAVQAATLAGDYWDLELDLATGERGTRYGRLESLFRALTGAEAALITVNNASAVLLATAAVAHRREVLVSRGQAVEIGGGFRVPEILRQSGARLVEVGTTNRTRVSDYADAIGPKTAAILHVHRSNFRIVGFAEDAGLVDLGRLARDAGVTLIDDNGSGALIATESYGLGHEPMPQEALEAGATLVCFSGDKLLGGPQTGIILGNNDAITRLRRHPLARTLRPDKIAIAALAATLLSYVRGTPEQLPVWRMIATPADELAERARVWQEKALARGLEVGIGPGQSPVGGGSLPGETLPTTLLSLPSCITAGRLHRLRPAVIARTHEGRVLLDLRTVDPAQDGILLDLVASVRVVGHSRNRVIDSATR